MNIVWSQVGDTPFLVHWLVVQCHWSRLDFSVQPAVPPCADCLPGLGGAGRRSLNSVSCSIVIGPYTFVYCLIAPLARLCKRRYYGKGLGKRLVMLQTRGHCATGGDSSSCFCGGIYIHARTHISNVNVLVLGHGPSGVSVRGTNIVKKAAWWNVRP